MRLRKHEKELLERARKNADRRYQQFVREKQKQRK